MSSAIMRPSDPLPLGTGSEIITLAYALIRSAIGCLPRENISVLPGALNSPTSAKVGLSLVGPLHRYQPMEDLVKSTTMGTNLILLFESDLPGRLEFVKEAHRTDFDHVFGTPEWRTARSLDVGERGRYAMELFKTQLIKRSPQLAVRSYSFRGGVRAIIASPDLIGLEWLKRTVWCMGIDLDPVDNTDNNHPIGVVRYDDQSWRTSVRRKVQGRFQGRTMGVDAIREYVLIETPFPFDQDLLERMAENRFIKKMIGPEGTVRYRFPLGKV
jgi:hypothetical protein